MKRVLVTGATGMLGSYVALQARDAGMRVRALVRDPSSGSWLAERSVELATGNLGSAASLRKAVEGCDAVVHAAAEIGSGGEGARYVEGNVVGTQNVVDAATWAGARMVHVSSTAVFGAARYRTELTDEDVPLPRLPERDAYGRSKQAAEGVVLGAVERDGLWATVVRPPVMYGRRDRQFVPRVAPILTRGFAPLPAGGHTTLPLVHAGSVARAVLTALAHDGALGRVYHLTEDAPVTVATLWQAAARGLDVRLRRISVPRVVFGVGIAGLAVALGCGGRLDLAHHARGTYRMLTRDNPFSAARARAELAWRPDLDPAESLADAFRWWKGRWAGRVVP